MGTEIYHIYLNADEQKQIIISLLNLKNRLIEQGKYTDAVDDILCKVLSAKKRKIKIKYIWYMKSVAVYWPQLRGK